MWSLRHAKKIWLNQQIASQRCVVYVSRFVRSHAFDITFDFVDENCAQNYTDHAPLNYPSPSHRSVSSLSAPGRQDLAPRRASTSMATKIGFWLTNQRNREALLAPTSRPKDFFSTWVGTSSSRIMSILTS